MAEIGKTLGKQRLQDFVSVKKVAEQLGLNPQTIKRWLKERIVPEVSWGRDRRGWIYIYRDHIGFLEQYRDGIDTKN